MSARPDVPVTIRVQPGPIDLAAEPARLSRLDEAGAVVAFTGICRSEAGRLAALELEHYPGMVEAELEQLVAEAVARWPLLGAAVVHRHGRVLPGETIVQVVTASSHRAAAFEAAAFLMDWLKTSAPFWKREILSDGSVGDWVEARDSDGLAAGRWQAGKAAE